MEGSSERWVERKDSLQVASLAQAKDWTHSVKVKINPPFFMLFVSILNTILIPFLGYSTVPIWSLIQEMSLIQH